ncbi:polysaccharide export protein [Vibrio sp. SS-MA-C1-2]|uniref:polysaccharide biosynthesis/export family protein n=1 Tax=Vibrio sp. SS-MA-C1-2 TaxID=2908646 RepID=UPI001F2961E4|nr:polysaccharide biosynthesis/export family protein [Vibrio sp. SS-MA-C1-2]UJF17129.1 polysaccharide export protein [Vibrio sp. SS-MA-C1-2]
MKRVVSYLLSAFLLIISQSTFADVADSNYKLGAGDTVQISVYGEVDLSINSLYISNNGTFNYPYLGQINVLGKTPAQLQALIYKGLKGDYLISPKVRVNIVSFRNIYVNGEVQRPGGYPYQPGLTVDKAVALAGGFTERASMNKITIKSDDAGAKKSKAVLGQQVEPGDVIVVSESFF